MAYSENNATQPNWDLGLAELDNIMCVKLSKSSFSKIVLRLKTILYSFIKI